MKVTAEQIKRGLGLAIFLGGLLAPKTETKLDDRAVAAAKKLQSNDAVLIFVAALISGQVPSLSQLTAADRGLVDELVTTNAIPLVTFAAQIVE